jgi:CheY-like chemotaxis protein
MSLVGNLEDLGLGDILQIVSLSRKSGILTLQSLNREGTIYFLNGQVIRAMSSVFPENLGHLLLQRNLVDGPTLKKALRMQRESEGKVRIGEVLTRHFGISVDEIDGIVREQIEKTVYNFFGWSEGTFSFELGDSGELATSRLDPLQFMLDQGLNPQWLAMEGSRILDEKRHHGESSEEENRLPLPDMDAILGAENSAGVEKASAESGGTRTNGSRGTLFVVDDDESTREVFGQLLTERGFEVKLFSGGAPLLEEIARVMPEGVKPTLLVDLIMPKMDGSGILGGIEILERVKKDFPGLAVMVMSDHPNPDTENRVRRLGVPAVLAKPKKSQIRENPEGMGALIDDIELLFADASAKPSQLLNFGAELLREIGESGTQDRSGKGPESPGLHLLKGMLQELSNPSLGGGIILLVLRFASELMNRAVIFLAKENEIVGLGQFGIEMTSEMADTRIRRMKIPRGEDSVFSSILQEMTPRRIPPGRSRWDRYLVENLDGGEPEEIFLGPIVSEGKVVAIIYGDNLPEKKPIGETESFEIFLSQAGLAMEKALLERRLRVKEAS